MLRDLLRHALKKTPAKASTAHLTTLTSDASTGKNATSANSEAVMPDYAASLIELPGLAYIEYFGELVKAAEAKRYLEVGTNSGDSLAPVHCASVAVDPTFRLSQEVVGKKEQCLLFQLTSDMFFERYSPSMLLGGPIDVAFLDGMHLYEYLLRDIIAAEKHCHKDSLIVLHDCVPPTFEMTNRDHVPAMTNPRYRNYWTGDVWKIIPILREYRPDLKLQFIDCPPSGLVLVTNLDPTSTILQEHYDAIVAANTTKPHDLQTLLVYCKSIELIASRSVTPTQALTLLRGAPKL
jgi:hypothetical protein